MPQTDDMHVALKLVLDCPPDAAWTALRSPAVFRGVSFPLVAFEPAPVSTASGEFPEFWDEGSHRVIARALFGAFPAGEQNIDVRLRTLPSGIRVFEDRGGPLSGPLTVITKWRHRMAIASWPDGRTLYRDRLEFSAGLLTPVVWVALWVFWQWRARGLVGAAPGFRARFASA